MSRVFRSAPEASAELEQASLWYERQRPGLGLEFLNAIDATLNRIALWPQAARPVPGIASDVAARKAPVGGFPYHVAYLEMSGTIHILAIAHDSREPDYWHSRMK